jgi:hypothetical protein
MSDAPVVTDVAVQVAAEILTKSDTKPGEVPSAGKQIVVIAIARLMLEAAAPHLAYAAENGNALVVISDDSAYQQARARIAALEHLAAAMLAEFRPTSGWHLARVGQVQVKRWETELQGSTDA